ncbi:MAG: YARHG domain-containing protein [Bacteroidota bacterium]
MKLKLAPFFSLLLVLMACGESPKGDQPSVKEPTVETPVVKENSPIEQSISEKTTPVEQLKTIDLENVYGHYVGDFEAKVFGKGKKPSYANKINITIEVIDGETATGYSVVAGNARPFSGTVRQVKDHLNFRLKEPGDDRYDGVFDFNIYPKRNQLVGEWYANDERLAVTVREFDLRGATFTYNPNDTLTESLLYEGLYDSFREGYDGEEGLTQDVLAYNPSITLLKKEDVENMYQADLEVLRNSIYARHGYSFKNRRMRYLFDRWVDWYIPMKTNILADLTDLEKQNIELLKRYEQHAEKYYDVFGR